MIKKVLFFLGLLLAGVALSRAGSQDLVKGVDMTARATITQAALNQLVDNATVATNKGLVIFTNNTPSVAADPKLVRYIWLDSSVYPPAIKTYDTNTSTWVASTIGTGSVGTAQLADGAVSTVKIANSAVDNSKLADDSVTSAKIVDGTIIAGDLAANSVINSKIAAGSVNGTSLGTNVIQNYHLQGGIIYPSNLVSGFVIPVGGLAANSIYNSNLVAGIIQNTNLAPSSVANTNLMSSSVLFTNLGTNVTWFIPIYTAIVDAAGAIAYQASPPGITAGTSSRHAQGIFSFNFGAVMGSTNYVVAATPISITSGSRSVQVSTNGLSRVSYVVKNAGGTEEDEAVMLIIYGSR